MRRSDNQILEELYTQILEAPVSDVTTTSDIWNMQPKANPKPGKNSPDYEKKDYVDQALINSPQWRQKIKLKVAPNVPFNFRIIFINTDNINMSDPNLELYTEIIKKTPSTPDVITAVLGSSGDPLSPWICSHKIGHSILSRACAEINKTPAAIDSYKAISRQLTIVLSHLLNMDPSTASFPREKIIKVASALHSTPKATFASARQGTIISLGEWIYELVAMYLQKGYVFFDSVPNTNFTDKRAQKMAADITTSITQALTLNKGKVIVDF